MIQNALQAVCGYHSKLRTYIHKLDLELYVITGNDVTYATDSQCCIL